MHILEKPRPCQHCGGPALKLYGPNSDEPRCTMCQARIYRENGSAMREAAPPIRDKGKQDIDAWEPAR